MGFGKQVLNLGMAKRLLLAMFAVSSLTLARLAYAADSIEGRVLGAGALIAKSTVTLWSALPMLRNSWLKRKLMMTAASL